ncbi:MAG TPA: MFS transporter [Verrucomicrobiae bacterium]|jgi:ACS family hexuronate transporter-like MFS transporter
MQNRKDIPAAPPISPAGWALLLLLVVASVLFVMDRQALAILKSTISNEFGTNNGDYGLLVTAYLMPYTIGYLFSGQLIDRWGTSRCTVIFLIGMSAATVACGLARNFHELLAAQVFLGLSESGIVPSIMVMVTRHYPAERRGLVLTLFQALQSIGPVITPPVVAAITLAHGWRYSFLVPGLLSFALAFVWFFSDSRARPATAPTAPRPNVIGFSNVKLMFTSPALRGVLLVRMVTDPAWFFLIYWQAAFLQDRAGWTLADLGRWIWLPPAVAGVVNIIAGASSDRHLRRGGDAPTARRIVLQRIALLAPCFALAPFVTGNRMVVLLTLVLCYVMANVWLTMVNVLVTEVAPAGMVATVYGMLSALGGASSFIFNSVAGSLVDHLGYGTVFIFCACLYPVGLWILRIHYAGLKNPSLQPELIADQTITQASKS